MRLALRLAFGAVAVSVSLIATALPVFAEDLEDYLAEAGSAEYSGRRIVVTNWEGTSTVGVYEFAHAGGVALIDDGTGEAMVGAGRMSNAGGGVILPEWSAATLADRYTTEDALAVTRLGRDAHVISVREDGAVRATIVFDDTTGAPLATEVYDGEGRLFRYTAMLDFDPSPVLVYSEMATTGYAYDVMTPDTEGALPAEVGDYVRADAYSGPDDARHTFYTDGLFSFSVFEIGGETTPSRFDDAADLDVNGASYALIVEPTDVWVSWSASGTTYVLVGDLPPDQLAEVLEDLPRPSRPGIFRRLWRGLFG